MSIDSLTPDPIVSRSEFWRVYHEIADATFKAKSKFAPLYSKEEIDEHITLQTALRSALESFAERLPRETFTPMSVDDFIRQLEQEMKLFHL